MDEKKFDKNGNCLKCKRPYGEHFNDDCPREKIQEIKELEALKEETKDFLVKAAEIVEIQIKEGWDIPEEPFDGQIVYAFSITHGKEAYVVEGIKYVYHRDTKWDDYAPNQKGRGADLVDDWMVYDLASPNYANGRLPGWKNLIPHLQMYGWFPHYNDALELAKRKSQEHIRSIEKRLESAIKDLDFLSESQEIVLKGVYNYERKK